MTCAALAERVDRFGSGLQGLGVDRVAEARFQLVELQLERKLASVEALSSACSKAIELGVADWVVAAGSRWNVVGQATDGPLAGRSPTRLVHADVFAFAWLAFHPDTGVAR